MQSLKGKWETKNVRDQDRSGSIQVKAYFRGSLSSERDWKVSKVYLNNMVRHGEFAFVFLRYFKDAYYNMILSANLYFI